MENGIGVSFFTSAGRYIGGLSSENMYSTERVRKQILYSEDETFALSMAKKFVKAKIANQIVVAKRYMNKNDDLNAKLFPLRNAKRKVEQATNLKQVMGFEGLAARSYFSILSENMPEGFEFKKRNRPAEDPFNAMLNFGYSLLTKEICGELVNRRVMPQIGLMHREHDTMPALACDLIEEWRPVIVDSTVLSLIHGNEIKKEMFFYEEYQCKMKPEALKILLTKLEKKMYTQMQYLEYINKPVSYRKAIWHQAERMGKVLDTGNADYYKAVMLR